MKQLLERIQNRTLARIAGKVIHHIPVDRSEARYMLGTNDILDLGAIAHYLRTRLHGDITCYGVNMNLNYTNICELRCPLCAFSRDAADEDSFVLSLEIITERVQAAIASGIDEIHIVGGLNPDLPLNYYEEMLQRIKKIKKDIFIAGFTVVEYDYFARINQMPVEEVLKRLIAAGVNAIPGGGAEIFASSVRKCIAPKKISGERWLEIMRIAHQLGLKTNATMLYNHCEDTEDIVDHLFKIRDLQDSTGGFKTFVPLPFHEENTRIKAKRRILSGYDDIRIYATSRIVLHNIPHLKVLWMYLGEKMSQVLLRFGVDELGGTYYDEKVVHAAGARTPHSGSEASLRRLIKEADLVPKRNNAGYQT